MTHIWLSITMIASLTKPSGTDIEEPPSTPRY
jgi:hypothetical protein